MNETKDILQQVQSGALTVDEALLRLKLAPFEDLGYAKVDHHRALRQGAAEVIYGEGKTTEHIAGILTSMLANGERTVLVTRLSAEKAAALTGRFPLDYHADARMGMVHQQLKKAVPTQTFSDFVPGLETRLYTGVLPKAEKRSEEETKLS